MAEHIPFTAREEEVAKLAWRCLKETPEMDYDKLMQLGGFTTRKTATNTWGVVRKKLMQADPESFKKPAAEAAGGSGADSGATKAKATPRKRAKKASAFDDADSDDE